MEKQDKTRVKIELGSPILKLSTEANIDEIDEIIQKLSECLLKTNKKIGKIIKETPYRATEETLPITTKDSLSKVALRLDIDINKLQSSKLIGIKNEKVQIFKPQKFSPQEAIVVLVFCYEVGLNKYNISYEELKEIYQDSGIKGKTPFLMAMTNIKNNGYIDKKLYNSSKEILLTAKGSDKAAEYIKSKLL